MDSQRPVAWLVDNQAYTIKEAAESLSRILETPVIPLYTHQYQRPHNSVLVPCDKLAEMQAKLALLKAHPIKELTDEEKWEVFTNLARSPDLRADMIRFADSILRKAQEK
jgi:hypothetical protein